MENSMLQFIPFILIFVVMYFLIIRPQAKKQKQLEKMRKELKSGDEIITNGGIHGKVIGIENEKKIIKIKVDTNTTLRVEQSNITIVQKK